MHDLYAEARTAHDTSMQAWDIARHLYARIRQGKVAIVASQSASFLPCLQKQWQRLMRKALQERTSTTNAIYILEISCQVAHMQATRFAIGAEAYHCDVAIATSSQFLQAPPICQTMYITEQLPRQTYHQLTAWMPKNCLGVYYDCPQ